MVLGRKTLFLFFFPLLLTHSVMAQYRVTKTQRKAFKAAKEAYKSENYQRAENLINRYFNLKTSTLPLAVYALAAYTYLKNKKFKNSQIIFSFLIKKRYGALNRKMMVSYVKSGDEDLPEAPDKLYKYYHYRGEALSQLYVEQYQKLSQKRRSQIKKYALMYTTILLDSDYEGEDVEIIQTRIENFDKKLADKKYKSFYFANLAWTSWKDKIKFLYTDGRSIEIESTGQGYCLGGGMAWANAYWEYNINGCLASVSMTTASDGTFLYSQTGVAALGLLLSPTALYKPKAKNVAFGIALPIMYKSSNYEEPNTSDCCTIENQTEISFGFGIEARWELKQWSLFTKFSNVFKLSSSLWMMGLQYNFE